MNLFVPSLSVRQFDKQPHYMMLFDEVIGLLECDVVPLVNCKHKRQIPV